MIEDYAAERRRYIAEIRQSFDTDDNGERHASRNVRLTNRREDTASFEQTESGTSFLFLKVRFLLALFIFLAFCFCKFTGYHFYGYQAKDFIDIVSDNHYYTNLQDYVMIQMQDSNETDANVAEESGQ